MLGIVDDPYLAWCIDEAAAIAHNLLLKQTADDQESILEGPSGRYDPRIEEAQAKRGKFMDRLPNGTAVLSGSFPVKWRE